MASGVYKRTNPPWNKGLTKETDSRVNEISLWHYMHPLSYASRNKQANTLIESYRKGKIVVWNKGKVGLHHHTQETKDKIGTAAKEHMQKRWKNPEYVKMQTEKLLISNHKVRPTNLTYVGNGEYLIPGTSMNPDFINKETKQIIEVFGCYWHGCKKCKCHNMYGKRQSDYYRISELKTLGYSVLVIWEHELRYPEVVLSMIRNFMEGQVD
jgi:hypothetical protein